MSRDVDIKQRARELKELVRAKGTEEGTLAENWEKDFIQRVWFYLVKELVELAKEDENNARA